MKKKGPPARPVTYEISSLGCHNCTSHACNGDGYPYISLDGMHWRLSRYIFTNNKGKIPNGKVVRHTCDNRKCINPDHLILGTLTQNNRDRVARNRNRDQNGSKNNMSKLTEKQVVEIYTSKLPHKELSVKYKISKSVIETIKGKRSWRKILNGVELEVINRPPTTE